MLRESEKISRQSHSARQSVSLFSVLACALVSVMAMLLSSVVVAERIKDLTSVAGIRSNQLVGYGLVVGLDGTGDKTNQAPFATQSFINMLKQFGITVPSGTRLQLKNMAAVTVHADLPPFAKPGQTIDVTVSSIANAKSLRGGSLLMTPLKGADGNVYAMAQGNLVVGGLGVEGADGSSITVNIPSVGRIPHGASVERSVPTSFASGQPLVLNLNRGDFTTAKRIADRINEVLGPQVARPMDATSIRVDAPVNPAQRVSYLSLLENLEVTPGEEPARVVINSRTGTIVVGKNVRVSPVAVTHGSLTVTIAESLNVSQPNPLSDGATVVVPETDIGVDVDKSLKPMFKFAPGPSLDDIVRAVNQVGAAPGDLMAILEALKEAGALKAELMVI